MLGMLRRRARLVGIVVLAGTALALALGLRAPTLYTAKALVAIERPLTTVPGTNTVPVEPLDAAAVREEMQVLNSYEQAKLVVEDMDLAADPEFQPQPPSTTARLRAAIAGWLASLLPASHPADGRELA
ncbi:MAG TPA: Wzz/FepE/Etk N-terminal domain-containing protein, partial [Candidatus Dormibacteraeota bacterium]